MQKKYDHPYGGQGWIWKDVTVEVAEEFVLHSQGHRIHLDGVTPGDGKVLDVFLHHREVVGYPVDSGMIRLEVIDFS